MQRFFLGPFISTNVLFVLQAMVDELKKYVPKYGDYVNVLDIEGGFESKEDILLLLSRGLPNVCLQICCFARHNHNSQFCQFMIL